MRLRSNNPVYSRIEKMGLEGVGYEVATYRGITAKALYFTLVVIAGAFLGLYLYSTNLNLLVSLLAVSGIVGFISAIISFAFPNATKISGTIYALCEGLLVGLISFIFEGVFRGIVFTAILGTVSVLFVVCTLYFTRLVKVNSKFVRFLLLFSLSMIFCHLTFWILSLIFPSTFGPFVQNYQLSVFSSLLMIFLASLYLMFDLENIRQVVEGGQPKSLEWFAAFGLVYTIIWLYLEVLQLIAKLAKDR
jgi:uncharacterized YccA/Bax inhibitor family protein